MLLARAAAVLLAIALTFGGLAAAEALPYPLQNAAVQLGSYVGIDFPEPDHPEDVQVSPAGGDNQGQSEPHPDPSVPERIESDDNETSEPLDAEEANTEEKDDADEEADADEEDDHDEEEDHSDEDDHSDGEDESETNESG